MRPPLPSPRLLLSSLAVVFAAATGAAQTLDDVIRYSEVNPFGTARSLGTANSMAAIGADWTAVQGNPAGLAAFRSNEFTITLGGLLRGTSDATLDDDPGTFSDVDARFALPQLALVFTTQPIGSRWTQLNFGFGVSQTNRFEENIAFDGTTPGSVSDFFLEEALGEVVDGQYIFNPYGLVDLENGQFPAALALQAGVILDDPNNPNAPFFTDYRFVDDSGLYNFGEPINKRGKVERKGHLASFDFSAAGNYEDKLQVGATIGIVSSSFEELNRLVETDRDDAVDFFDRLDYRRTITIDGTGILARVGASYRFSQALRLGLAYHSPTFTAFTDNLSEAIDYRYTEDDMQLGGDAATTQADVLEYNVITPSQYRVSLASVLGQRGFVSAEVGYINYAGAKVRYGDDVEGGDDFEEIYDELVADNLNSAVQLRLGGELNVRPLQVRAGFEYLGAPIDGEDAALGFAAGVGFRQNRLALDLGYKLSVRPDRVYRPYTVQSDATALPINELFQQPEVRYTPTLSMLALTLGWKLTRL